MELETHALLLHPRGLRVPPLLRRGALLPLLPAITMSHTLKPFLAMRFLNMSYTFLHFREEYG